MEQGDIHEEYLPEEEVLEPWEESESSPEVSGKCSKMVARIHAVPLHVKVTLLVILAGVVLVLLMGVSGTAGFFTCFVFNGQDKYVWYNYNEVYPDRTDPKQAGIMDTREFQERLKWEIYADRKAAVNDLLAELRILTGEELPEDEFETQIYQEMQRDSILCGHQYSELRIRIPYDENGVVNENSTSVDINENGYPGISKSSALSWDLSPNPNYVSEEKIEHDIHHDHHKFNRKTKIKNMPTNYTITTCEEVVELFPNAFQEGYDPQAEVTQRKGDRFIWEYAWSGKMFYHSTKAKISWTLYYDTLEDAMNMTLAPYHISEFSMRVYSPGKGMIPFYRESLDFFAAVFRGVRVFYGKEE